MKIYKLLWIALAMVLGAETLARSAEIPVCPATVLSPLALGFANPGISKSPFEGDWCGFWAGTPSAIRVQVIGPGNVTIITTYIVDGTVFVSMDRGYIKGTTLFYSTPKRGKLGYALMDNTLAATLEADGNISTATFRRVK